MEHLVWRIMFNRSGSVSTFISVFPRCFKSPSPKIMFTQSPKRWLHPLGHPTVFGGNLGHFSQFYWEFDDQHVHFGRLPFQVKSCLLYTFFPERDRCLSFYLCVSCVKAGSHLQSLQKDLLEAVGIAQSFHPPSTNSEMIFRNNHETLVPNTYWRII